MKKKAVDIIPDDLLHQLNISPDEEFEIEYADPTELLVPERLDIICKLEYISSKVKCVNYDYSKSMYLEHLKAINCNQKFWERSRKKRSVDNYLDSFNQMIKEVYDNKEVLYKSVVIVGKNNVLIYGSHRTAIAVYMGIRIPIIRLSKDGVIYNYEFFRNHGLADDTIGYMVLKYISYTKRDNYLLLLRLTEDAVNRRKLLDDILVNSSAIIYKKDVLLTMHGIEQLMLHMYHNQDNTDNACRFSKYNDEESTIPENKEYYISIYAIRSLDIGATKNFIRDFFIFDNHLFYLSNSNEETLFTGKSLLNSNSIYMLNYGYPFRFPNFYDKVQTLINVLYEKNMDLDDYLIDSSAVLALFGCRDARDIDYLTLQDFTPESSLYDCHNIYSKYYGKPLDDIIYNPKNFFYFLGIKYVSLHCLEIMKKNRHETKDIIDVRTIRKMKLKNLIKYNAYRKQLYDRLKKLRKIETR